jgi:broad specificity phosphatase PhoE
MAFLEIRRHSHRKSGGGSQLSQSGVDLARRIGSASGPYREVVTSVLPRTRETAIAMGFAVDREIVTDLTDEDVLGAIERILPTLTDDDRSVLGGWPGLLRRSDPSGGPTGDQEVLYRWSQTIAGSWRDLMTPHGNSGDRVLFIGHSGHLEAGLLSCLPGLDHGAWGGTFGPMEGALLEFAGEPARFRSAQPLRL